MYKSLPINLILASQEKPQLLILATEHGAHSLCGSRDELVLAKERSYSSVGKKIYSTRQMGGKGDPPVPTPGATTGPDNQPAARVTVIPHL